MFGLGIINKLTIFSLLKHSKTVDPKESFSFAIKSRNKQPLQQPRPLTPSPSPSPNQETLQLHHRQTFGRDSSGRGLVHLPRFIVTIYKRILRNSLATHFTPDSYNSIGKVYTNTKFVSFRRSLG